MLFFCINLQIGVLFIWDCLSYLAKEGKIIRKYLKFFKKNLNYVNSRKKRLISEARKAYFHSLLKSLDFFKCLIYPAEEGYLRGLPRFLLPFGSELPEVVFLIANTSLSSTRLLVT